MLGLSVWVVGWLSGGATLKDELTRRGARSELASSRLSPAGEICRVLRVQALSFRYLFRRDRVDERDT